MNDLTPTKVDPRQIAAALEMDTYELAEQLATWAYSSLPGDVWRQGDLMSLDVFDDYITKARRQLEAAHESMRAYTEDNPDTVREDS